MVMNVQENCMASCRLCEVAFPSFQPNRCSVAVDDFGEEDATIAFLMGRIDPNSIGALSIHFPKGMSKLAMYPISSSEYTNPADEVVYDVQCFVPAVEATTFDIECPAPFVPRTKEGTARICVQPCPAPVYSDGESQCCGRSSLVFRWSVFF
jgi:hypothetical protein